MSSFALTSSPRRTSWRRWAAVASASATALGAAWMLLSGLPALRAGLAHPWIRQCMAQPVASAPSSFFLPPIHSSDGRYCLGAPSTDTSLRNAPEGGRAFAEQRDLTRIEVWDAKSQRFWTLAGHTGRVRCYALSAPWLLTASDSSQDTAVRLWSLETGMLVRTFDAGQPACWGGFGFMGFSGDQRRVVTATADRKVRIWDAVTGRAEATIAPSEGVTQFTLSADGQTLALGGFSGDISVWEVRSGQCMRQWHAHDRFGSAVPDAGGVEALVFSPDGRVLRSRGPVNGGDAERAWDVATGAIAGR